VAPLHRHEHGAIVDRALEHHVRVGERRGAHGDLGEPSAAIGVDDDARHHRRAADDETGRHLVGVGAGPVADGDAVVAYVDACEAARLTGGDAARPRVVERRQPDAGEQHDRARMSHGAPAAGAPPAVGTAEAQHQEHDGGDRQRGDGTAVELAAHGSDPVTAEIGENGSDGADEHDDGRQGGQQYRNAARVVAGAAFVGIGASYHDGTDCGVDDGEDEDRDSDVALLGEAVNGRRSSGADERGAEQGEQPRREAPRPRPPHADPRRGVDCDEGGEPDQQRRVLHRVPRPVAAPPLFHVAPSGAERHRRGEQRHRGEQPAAGGSVGIACERRGDRGSTARGEAGVEQRRVDRHRRVLEDRVHPEATGGWDGEAVEWRGEHQVGAEEHGDGRRRRPGHRCRDPSSRDDSDSDRGDDAGEQQQRTLHPAPHTSQPVRPRRTRPGLLGDVRPIQRLTPERHREASERQPHADSEDDDDRPPSIRPLRNRCDVADNALHCHPS
jgi:hypothetical protein